MGGLELGAGEREEGDGCGGEGAGKKRSSRGIGEGGLVRQISLGEEHHSQEEKQEVQEKDEEQ